MRCRSIGRQLLVLLSCALAGPRGAEASEAAGANAAGASPAVQIRLDPGHRWRPPFGLERVGRSVSVIVESSTRPEATRYVAVAHWKGKEAGRNEISFPDKPPYSARATFEGVVSADEIVVLAEAGTGAQATELARQAVAMPDLEADAVARADRTINPVDVGTILVPAGWLLLRPGQSASVEVAGLSRSRDLSTAHARAWYASAPERAATCPLALRTGVCARAKFGLPDVPARGDRDELFVAIEDDAGQVIWRKTITVMRVPAPPPHPPFGATYERLRYDAPISVREPATGKFSSMKYEDAWNRELNDVVVRLPNGGRFVFWRGSSYIPFWAGRDNTGACYEWAEIISRPEGAVDCVEPLMDKELRFGRVEIVESTAARVHVRWRYQSTDLEYKVWGDEAVEDYYFYPDGFGTRVVNLKADARNDYELSEFIILTPQGTYPLNVLPESPVDALYLSGRVHRVKLPGPQARPGDVAEKLPGGEPAIYRLRFNQHDDLAAVCFSPEENALPPWVFGPFFDGGLLVTPCYWGSHWPLARGNATGSAIDARIAVTPCHNSVMTWANHRPRPLESREHAMLDSQGRSRVMTVRRWAWLIGMTSETDDRLTEWARSYATPPGLIVQGGRIDFRGYAPERRALCLAIDGRDLRITLEPVVPCVNPVFELDSAPPGRIAVSLGNEPLAAQRCAWDGHTLWLDATIKARAELRVNFGPDEAAQSKQTR